MAEEGVPVCLLECFPMMEPPSTAVTGNRTRPGASAERPSMKAAAAAAAAEKAAARSRNENGMAIKEWNRQSRRVTAG